MSLAEAESDLLSSKKHKSIFHRYKVEILKSLCTKYNLAVIATGKRLLPIKADYTTALLAYKVTTIVSRMSVSLTWHIRDIPMRQREPLKPYLFAFFVERRIGMPSKSLTTSGERIRQ